MTGVFEVKYGLCFPPLKSPVMGEFQRGSPLDGRFRGERRPKPDANQRSVCGGRGGAAERTRPVPRKTGRGMWSLRRRGSPRKRPPRQRPPLGGGPPSSLTRNSNTPRSYLRRSWPRRSPSRAPAPAPAAPARRPAPPAEAGSRRNSAARRCRESGCGALWRSPRDSSRRAGWCSGGCTGHGSSRRSEDRAGPPDFSGASAPPSAPSSPESGCCWRR